MPAPFAVELCGYRASGNANISDNGDKFSKELSRQLFDVMGVSSDQPEPKSVGTLLEVEMVNHLSNLRPDLFVEGSRSALTFEQYAHLGVFEDFRRNRVDPRTRHDRLMVMAQNLAVSRESKAIIRELGKLGIDLETANTAVERMISAVPEESFLRLDVVIAGVRKPPLQALLCGLSSKWTLRTDRAQDCVSQGSKLAGLRRGMMPHYAVVTMEARPSMLRIIADGSGAVDCVYHLDLPSLSLALDRFREGTRAQREQVRTFDRIVQQGRLRDYADLTEAVTRLPAQTAVASPLG